MIVSYLILDTDLKLALNCNDLRPFKYTGPARKASFRDTWRYMSSSDTYGGLNARIQFSVRVDTSTYTLYLFMC